MKHDFTTHEMTSLYTHFGPYGRRDVHIHHCMKSECSDVVLVGDGRACGGKGAPHHFERWNDGTNEWEPLP